MDVAMWTTECQKPEECSIEKGLMKGRVTNLPSGETSNLPLVCSPDLDLQGTFMLFPSKEDGCKKNKNLCHPSSYLSSCHRQSSVGELDSQLWTLFQTWRIWDSWLIFVQIFQLKTVHSGAPSCANREVLEVDRLNFWIFLPVDLKQCHCPVVASHLKHCN